MLKRIWVPTEKERYHRQVTRRRCQLIDDRIRPQSRIKAEVQLHGLNLSAPHGKWTKIFLGNLGRIRFSDRWMQESFKRLLEQYYFLDEQINKQTDLLAVIGSGMITATEAGNCQKFLAMQEICVSPTGNISETSSLLARKSFRATKKSDSLSLTLGCCHTSAIYLE